MLKENACGFFVYSTLRHEREGDTVQCRVRNTHDTMLVVWESSTIIVVVMVFALMIVTVDCGGSVFGVRKRRLWDANDISNLIRSARVVHEFDDRLQYNYDNRDVYEFPESLKYPTQIVYATTTEVMWIFATTCYEYFVEILMEYIIIAANLIRQSKLDVIDQETIELIRFVDDDIYSLPTFLFDVGHRKLETILQTVHLLRTLSFSSQVIFMTASGLKNVLQKFVRDHSLKPNKENAKLEVSVMERVELKNRCPHVKYKLTKISKIFDLKSTLLINTQFYARNIEERPTNSISSFDYYIYEIEKCTVYVSITNVFRIIWAPIRRVFNRFIYPF